MRAIRWWAVWGVLLSCGAAWGDERLPAPEGSKVKEALGLVREVFAEEYAAAKTSPQKAALAKKILQEGATGEHDPTSRYALLRVARDLAAIAGDAETALKAAEQLDRRYRVDHIAMKAVVLAKVADRVRLPADHKKFLPLLGKAYDEAVAADRYDLARQIGKLAAASAAKTRDPSAKKSVADKLKKLSQLEADYAKIKEAVAVLETKPTDPEANLAVGKYRCFVRGDWDDGLPYLALGSDPVLQKLAEQEVVQPDSAADQVKLANGWWDLGEKEKDAAAKTRMQQRAGLWYKKAVPNVSGLAKVKIEKRLEQIANIERPSGPKKGKPVDLLALIDPGRDTVRGTWRKTKAGLISPLKDYARLRIPYVPPEEYALTMVVTQLDGKETLVIGLVAAGRQCMVSLDAGKTGDIVGLDLIDGKPYSANATTRRGKLFVRGKTNRLAVTVKKSGITVTCNDRPIVNWRGDVRRLSLHQAWQVGDGRVLFVGDYNTSFLIHSITLTPITGDGPASKDGK